MRVIAGPADLAALAGTRLGASGFRTIEQRQIDAFAALTGDQQWIHTDAERAATGPFGVTIAHGMLTLSLGVALLAEVFRVDGANLVLHKGFDQVRFGVPVRCGSRVRLLADLTGVTPRARGFTEATLAVTMEIERRTRPAYTALARMLYQEAPACVR
ncbi:MaoC family dehydratase [Actinophytocola sp.]|uniref:MaoC family dehydratase n=1 Tax=Actinophytocola sp. TaxID=1872138 RepID=UPI002D805259|nr:MaoC family dehydratase [Actinophytocola sp.]HET9139834.1 MaoC family dehydratase [Actinophytocola sp.]